MSTNDTDAMNGKNASSEWTWREIENIIKDLKIDGYEPTDFKSNVSDAVPEKRFVLEVER